MGFCLAVLFNHQEINVFLRDIEVERVLLADGLLVSGGLFCFWIFWGVGHLTIIDSGVGGISYILLYEYHDRTMIRAGRIKDLLST